MHIVMLSFVNVTSGCLVRKRTGIYYCYSLVCIIVVVDPRLFVGATFLTGAGSGMFVTTVALTSGDYFWNFSAVVSADSLVFF
jgi:hypothetical protein